VTEESIFKYTFQKDLYGCPSCRRENTFPVCKNFHLDEAILKTLELVTDLVFKEPKI
jgi:hypothetical protein